MGTNYKQAIENSRIYTWNQITLREHEQEHFMGRLPNQLVRNRTNSSGKGPVHLENVKRKINKYELARLDQAQLIWKSASSFGKEQNIGFNQNYLFYHAFFRHVLIIIIFFFCVFLGFILGSKIKLNIITLSHTSNQVPSLEGDWSLGDHVHVPGWVTPKISLTLLL